MPTAPSFHTVARYLVWFIEQWSLAIREPKHALVPGLKADDPVVVDALEYYLATLAFSLILQSPFILGQLGDLAEKLRLAAASVFGLVEMTIFALVTHIAFSKAGGTAGFSGTFMASVYASAPYTPLIALAGLLVFAALPPHEQHHALSPIAGPAVLKRVWNDPQTKHGLVILGSLGGTGIAIWSGLVQLASMKFVHQLGFWRFILALIYSVVLAAIVVPILKAIGKVFNVAPPEETAPLAPSDTDQLPPAAQISA